MELVHDVLGEKMENYGKIKGSIAWPPCKCSV